MGARQRVLIVVKTYPLPSETYDELVCTAGVLEDGSFVRIYPIDYRYLPYWQWFKKYQWIEVELEKNEKDPRHESYRPLGEIKPLGEPLDTRNKWKERKKFVLAKNTSTLCQLQTKDQSEVSLGIVKPAVVEDFIIEKAERAWKPKWQALFKQQRLFGPERKPLEKIPFKFSYKFKCQAPDCNGHKMIIEDWEIGALYRSMLQQHKDEIVACEKVKQKFFDQMCADAIDTHFFVGTALKFGTWMILGVFWPKK